MNLIIITENSDLYSSKQFYHIGKKMGFSSLFANPYQSNLFVSNNKSNNTSLNETIVLHRTTGIRHDDFDLELSLDLEQKGALVLNSPVKLKILRDKLAQQIFFSNKNIPIIPSYAFRGRPNDNLIDDIDECFDSANNKPSKYILKTTRGNGGIGVNLLESKKSLKSVLDTFWGIKDQKFIIQPFLERATEYRFFFIADKLVSVVQKQTKESDFRANSTKADHLYVTDYKPLPKNILDIAYRIHSLSGLFYSGVDLIEHQSKIYFMELNAVPGFETLDKLSGKNIAKEILISAEKYYKTLNSNIEDEDETTSSILK